MWYQKEKGKEKSIQEEVEQCSLSYFHTPLNLLCCSLVFGGSFFGTEMVAIGA